jgi:hypothetical protein
MEPESSLPYSQVPATCPYPEPAPSPPTSWRSLLILSSHLRLGLPNSLFPSGFPTNTLCTLPHTRHMPSPSHYICSYMFQSIWTIFRELMLVLAKVTLFEILPLKYKVKNFQCRGSGCVCIQCCAEWDGVSFQVSLHTALDTHTQPEPRHWKSFNFVF